jgi:hypothetical protein
MKHLLLEASASHAQCCARPRGLHPRRLHLHRRPPRAAAGLEYRPAGLHRHRLHAQALRAGPPRPYAFLAFGDPIWIARIDLIGVRRVLAGQRSFAETVEYISVPVP